MLVNLLFLEISIKIKENNIYKVKKIHINLIIIKI